MYENDGFHPYEDNNDAQNRYEAQSSETSGNQWQQPLYQMPQQPEHTQPKKKHTAGRVVALALCCSLLGGAVGAGAMAIGTSMTGTSGGSRSSSTSTILQGDRPTSAINVSKIDTSKEMTAAEVYAANVNSTVGITTSITTNYWGYQTTAAASGSGFILTADGYILTNYHVIENSNSVKVTMYDGTSYDATIVGYDESNDIAVLKIDATGLTPVVLGDSDKLNVGDSVVAIGNPLGELTFSLTSGAVSALNREVTLSSNVTMDLIQTDCAINSGNSGGALINDEGKVVGITVSSHSGGVPSYSVPIRYLNSLIGDGTAYSPGEYNRNHKPDASRCYSKHYPVPDFGTVTGVTLLGTIREGTTTTYYYDREEVEAGDKILLRYYAALGENTFYQFTGGSFTSSSTYPYSVKLYETSYDGIPAISVVVSSNSFASIGGLPQTVDFLCRNLCITPNRMKADRHETYLRPKCHKNREKREKIK